MEEKLKDEIIDKIRREHNIVIKKNDPLFAMVTANEIVLREQIKQINKIFEEQQITSEIATQNYLNQAKEILEKKLTHLLKSLHQSINKTKKEQQQQKETEDKKLLQYPLLLLIIGMITGYSLALFIL